MNTYTERALVSGPEQWAELVVMALDRCAFFEAQARALGYHGTPSDRDIAAFAATHAAGTGQAAQNAKVAAALAASPLRHLLEQDVAAPPAPPASAGVATFGAPAGQPRTLTAALRRHLLSMTDVGQAVLDEDGTTQP
jgi:hypothetical protein